MATRWDEKPLTPGAGVLFPVLLLQPSGNTVGMGLLLGKFGGGSTAPLSFCFSSEEIMTGKIPICQKKKKHRREREKGEEESREDPFPP